MLFVTGGKGWGIASNGDTVCIGDEKDIQNYLASGIMADSIQGIGRQVLIQIKEWEQREKDNNGETKRGINAKLTTRKPIIGSNKRIRPSRPVGHKQPNVKRHKTEKGIALPSTKSQQ